MEVQKSYEEWKELVQFSKLIDLRKKELREKLKELEGEYVPIRSPESLQREYKMAELYKQGKTMQEIGDMYGITRERVRQLLLRNGVTREDFAKKMKDEIINMAHEGKTLEEVSSCLNIEKTKLRRLSKKCGVELMPKREKEIKSRDEKIIELYKSGWTQKEIAQELETVQANVSRILIKHGQNKREVPVDKVMEMKRKGYTAKVISKKFDTTMGNIYRIFSENKE